MAEGTLSPYNDPNYKALVQTLAKQQAEIESRDYKEATDLVRLADDLGGLRLGANKIFAFINKYITVLTQLDQEASDKRQKLYEEALAEGKSPSAADNHSRNLSRTEDSRVRIVENGIQQMKNDYERFNGICMYLQSRMKEANTERIMG